MLTGTLTLTSDVNLANISLYNGAKILVLSEEPIPGLNQNNNIVPATILLPPYPSVMAELDGNIEMAYNQYIGYMSTKEPSMFICAIIAALLNGTNLIILLGKNESEMKFVEWFYNYLAMVYGIMMRTDNCQFMYDNRFDSVILSSLYMYDLINHDEFFIRYPMGVGISTLIMPKLIMEINPYIETPSEEAYIKYFEGYMNRIKANHNQILINPLTRG